MQVRHVLAGSAVLVLVLVSWLAWGNALATADVVPRWGSQIVRVMESRKVIPGPGLPDEIAVQTANNNLDVVRHDGRVWLAFRTAPSHYASADTQLVLISSDDESTWRHELTVAMGSDLREPRLLSFRGRLFLYFARLGTNRFGFAPESAWVVASEPGGGFTQPQRFGAPGFIPWRVRMVNGKVWMLGYTGGGELYHFNGQALRVELLTTDDGLHFHPLQGHGSVVIAGGASETDVAFLDDGSLVAVARNEAGNGEAWGSLVCTAPAGALTDWSCEPDPRKFDSPLMFREGSEVYLVARRALGGEGHYDEGLRLLPDRLETLVYEVGSILEPKRCSLWRYDRETRGIEFVLDLPSAGDTCFAATLPGRDGERVIYDYSSDPAASGRLWVVGQHGRTSIYRHVLEFTPGEPAL